MSGVQPFFSVLIVNYNAGELLQNALNSLKKQSFRDFEVVVVDNDSQVNPITNLDVEGIPEIRVIRENANHGFAKGNNLGAQYATGKWLALLNPDAEADADWLTEIHKATQRHETCRVFACGQINMDEPDLLDGAGDAYFAFGIPWRGGFEHPISELPNQDSFCFSPCGASGFTMYHGFRYRTWAYLKNMPLSVLVLTFPGHIALMLYIYMRNMGHADLQGMRKGMWHGLKDGWALRWQSEYTVKPTREAIWNLVRSMAWNPVRLSQRGVHVWDLRPA